MSQAATQTLHLKGLSHTYGERFALQNLSLSVAPGEIVGLMGPNGCGKSTAFSLIAGLLPLKAGSCSLGTSPCSPDDWAFRARLGVVFQAPSLDRRLTALENLMLSARMHGFSTKKCRSVAETGLERAGLTDRAADIVDTFSGGMVRRLDLARALLHDPSFLLLDEPTTGLDLEAFEQTWRLLESLRKDRDVGVLLTTHRADEAERCDRLVVLNAGVCVLESTPAELLAQAGDETITIKTRTPADVAGGINKALNLVASVTGPDSVAIQVDCAATWVGPIAELFERDTLRGIHLTRPGLAEAYLQVTGSSLARRPAEESP